MTKIVNPSYRVPIGEVNIGGKRLDVIATRAFWDYISQQLFDRVGGADGPSTGELAINDDDDSGLEELKADFFRFQDRVLMAPQVEQLQQIEQLEAQVACLRAEFAELSKTVSGMQAGTVVL